MTPGEDASDPVLAALRGLPAIDVAPRRAQRLAVRCHAAIGRPSRTAAPAAGRGQAPWARTASVALVVTWSALYVLAVVHNGMRVWGL